MQTNDFVITMIEQLKEFRDKAHVIFPEYDDKAVESLQKQADILIEELRMIDE